MYVKLNCLVTITTQEGKVIKMNAINDVQIENSIDKVGSTANVKIPTSARLVSKGINTESMQSAKMFKRGDKILIQLGYDDKLVDEFEGYIYKVNLTTPLEIECEGFEYLLRKDVPTKTFASTNLKSVINYIIKETGLTIDNEVPEVRMVNYVIPANINGLEALTQLKEHYGLTIYFIKDKLYAGLDFVKYLGSVKYSLGVNTPRADELRYQYAEDVKLKVKAVQINRDNTKFEVQVGDKYGEHRTLFFYNAKSKEDLKRLAKAEMNKYKYTGYVGKITSFLEPYARAGMVADLQDIVYGERNGRYEIRSVTTSFGTSGARRSVEIGKAVSNG